MSAPIHNVTRSCIELYNNSSRMLSGYAIKVCGRVPVLSRVRRNSQHRAFAGLQPLPPSSARNMVERHRNDLIQGMPGATKRLLPTVIERTNGPQTRRARRIAGWHGIKACL